LNVLVASSACSAEVSSRQQAPYGRSGFCSDVIGDRKMKTIVAAFVLVLLAAGPTFAAGYHTRNLEEGRYSAYVPLSSSYSGDFAYSPSSREQMIHAN
jgi:hypothetical protein